MNKIPFSQPLIDEDVVAEVLDSLVNTGWLTSGPKVMALEAEVRAYTGAQAVVCVNSWTSGAMLALKWFGVGPGDEVIIPAYTYAATALCALNIGASVVMVDVLDDFTLDPAQLERAITPRTKAIIPVDLGAGPPITNVSGIYLKMNPYAHGLFQPRLLRKSLPGRLYWLMQLIPSGRCTRD